MTEKERELRVKRQGILHRYRDEKSIETIDALRELEALDRELEASQQSAQNAYYAFLTTLDYDYKAIKSAQGNTPRLLTAIDHTMSTLSAHAEYLKGGEGMIERYGL